MGDRQHVFVWWYTVHSKPSRQPLHRLHASSPDAARLRIAFTFPAVTPGMTHAVSDGKPHILPATLIPVMQHAAEPPGSPLQPLPPHLPHEAAQQYCSLPDLKPSAQCEGVVVAGAG